MKRAHAVLFDGGRALDWTVSMRQMGDGYGTYIVIAKRKDKCRLKIVCSKKIERRLLV